MAHPGQVFVRARLRLSRPTASLRRSLDAWHQFQSYASRLPRSETDYGLTLLQYTHQVIQACRTSGRAGLRAMTDSGEQQQQANGIGFASAHGSPSPGVGTPSPRLARLSSASMKRRTGCFLIGIAGGTASGKTTVCHKIMDRLQVRCGQQQFVGAVVSSRMADAPAVPMQPPMQDMCMLSG